MHAAKVHAGKAGHCAKSPRPELSGHDGVLSASNSLKVGLPFSQADGLQNARHALRLQRETGSLHTATKDAGPRCAPQAARSLHTASVPSLGSASVYACNECMLPQSRTIRRCGYLGRCAMR